MNLKDEYEDIYAWVDRIPLTRRKKNISRDFSDAVLLAELLKQFFPTIVDIHNYSSVSSKCAKVSNWETLNRKVLRKLGISISKEMILDLVSSTPGAIERLLSVIRNSIESGIQRSEENTLDINAEITSTGVSTFEKGESTDSIRIESEDKSDDDELSLSMVEGLNNLRCMWSVCEGLDQVKIERE
ncbi:hypothetical protein J437_LFUL002994 [Ladona fulva]|uniref:Calponin-homology (CH) domain-containing protein n=1 Tax=Ladona fulva TaxID=123851 RepID=A0A8K0JUA8_LADFU|nr:hypothetical protein J437_LFUL002994 [Ladona fulva]